MREKWIGEEDNTSGSYIETACKELSKRYGGTINAKKLYRFKSRFGEEYNITDKDVIHNIEKMLEEYEESTMLLYEYLYDLVVMKFGVMEFVLNIGHKIRQEHDSGYVAGKKQMQKEMRNLLGLK